MIANYEKRSYKGKEKIWAGRYHNLNNLPHWHLECELLYVESGQIIVSHNHQNYTLTENEAIFLGSGEVHYIKSETESIVSIIMFDPKLIRELTGNLRLASAKLEHHYPIPSHYAAIKQELDGQPLFFEIQSREYIISLMIQIFRGESLVDKQTGKEQSSVTHYKSLLDEINEKYSYITFSDAAAFMGFSEPYFSKFFRKMSGMTFSRYLNTVRLEHAIEMLKQNPNHHSMTDIASSCGFDTIRHFNRVFKDITGMSPRQIPSDYVLDAHPIRRIADAFDPTLKSSELL